MKDDILQNAKRAKLQRRFVQRARCVEHFKLCGYTTAHYKNYKFNIVYGSPQNEAAEFEKEMVRSVAIKESLHGVRHQ